MKAPRHTSNPSTRTWAVVATLLFVLPVLTVGAGGIAVAAEAADSSSQTAEPAALPLDAEFSEHVTVTATRLPDRETLRQDVPARVVVLTRRDIARSGARTLQELLARESGVIVYDQVGNGSQTTFDLRGFTHGTGTAVFIDGARINDPRNNSVALEAVPLDAIERVEIVPGSAAALAGGGSTAGVITIQTARARDRSGSLTLAGGQWDSWRYGGTGSWTAGRLGLSATAYRDTTDGFRSNANGDQKRFSARADYDFGSGRALSLTVLAGRASFGQPGALTPEELADDPAAVPYNSLDASSGHNRLVTLNFHTPLGAGFSFVANLSRRDDSLSTLTTGRAASLYGGFDLESDTGATGSTLQLGHSSPAGRWNGTVGAEWMDGRSDALGFFTSPADLSAVDRAHPDSDNRADRQVLAVYAQESWKPIRSLALTAGARWDGDRTTYDETIPFPHSDARRFSQLSLKGGAAWNPARRAGFYVSYGESFLPPTAEQLFSFPGFGSNPDLVPEDSRSWETGARGTWGADGPHDDSHEAEAAEQNASGSWEFALFRVDSSNEIVFDPDAPLGPYGANVNAGRTRRQGLEASVRARFHPRLEAFLNAARTNAEFRSGANAGESVPLVPGTRLTAGVQADLPAGFAVGADALYTGSQVLDNDDANTEPRLTGYTVVNLHASWRAGSGGAGSGGGFEGASPSVRRRPVMTLFVEARNLFDRSYATRGIFAYDFAFSRPAEFLTPAPGRRLLAGVEAHF